MVETQEVADNLTAYLGETAEGKEFWMKREPNNPLRKICFKGGGKIPEILEGGFSSIQIAKVAVEAYIQAKADAGKKVSKGRSSK